MVRVILRPLGESAHICSGVGKSTLLRHIALREVPIPSHITILFVEQEVDYPGTLTTLHAD